MFLKSQANNLSKIWHLEEYRIFPFVVAQFIARRSHNGNELPHYKQINVFEISS